MKIFEHVRLVSSKVDCTITFGFYSDLYYVVSAVNGLTVTANYHRYDIALEVYRAVLSEGEFEVIL